MASQWAHFWSNEFGRTILVMASAFLAALVFSAYHQVQSARLSKEKVPIHYVVHALRAYEADHGSYPESLDDLYPDYLESKDTLWVVEENGSRRPLIFHSDQPPPSSSPTVLIETPIPIVGKRITGYSDGQVLLEKWE